MNQLSWTLYLADVSQNIGFFFSAVAVVTSIALILWVISALICIGDGSDPGFWPTWRKIGFLLVPTFVVSFFVSSAIPTKETIYAIAASQMGEQVIKSPIGQKAEQAIEAWLDKQIASAKKGG